MLGSVQQGGDALVRLNDAFAPDPVFVDVPPACRSAPPCSLCTGVTGASAFPRTSVRVGEGSVLSVVEVFAGAEDRTAASWSR